MVKQVEQQLDAIRAACGRHGVARLELFGSAADPATFDPVRSDIDFLVRFRDEFDLGPWMRHYFGLREELSRILDRQVDLIMEGANDHPLFMQEAEKTRAVVYAAQDTEAA